MTASPHVQYAERLSAPPWLWLAGVLAAGSLGVAYAAPFTAAIGMVAFLVAGAVIMVALSARKQQRPFFRGETLVVDTPVMVPEGEHAWRSVNSEVATCGSPRRARRRHVRRCVRPCLTGYA